MGDTENVFDKSESSKVPVKLVVDGKEMIVGQAYLTPGEGGLVHVDMDLKGDETDVTKFLQDGITAYSYPKDGGPAHRMSETDIQRLHDVEPHDHEPKQHRDGKPPWCNTCRLTADYQKPEPRFNFGKPANPLRGDRDSDHR